MTTHDGDEDFVGQLEERRIKVAFDHAGTFIEVGHEFEQVCVFVDVVAGALGMRGEFARDFFSALVGPDDDAICAQLPLVVGKVGNLDLRLAEEAVARGAVADGHSTKGELEWLAVEQSHDPADGPDETSALQSGPRHGFWPRQIVDDAWEYFEEQLVGSAATLGDASGDTFRPWAL